MKRKFVIFSFVFFSFLLIGKGVFAESICPFDREMNLGDENLAVKELQQFLSLDKSVYSGPITGYFGNVTLKALKIFQEKAGLLANGKVDLATATVLCQVYLSYKASEPINNDNNLEADSSCFLTSESLEVGQNEGTSEEVLKLQKWLANAGFYPEKKFTGYFGSLTAKAVKRFQKSQGIIQTGIVGVKTKAVICGTSSSENDTTMSSAGSNIDLTISALDVNPQQIDVGTDVKFLVKEKNILDEDAGSHTTSFYINDKEVVNNRISVLSPGEDNLSINYNWKCEQKGIYIFKIFVDSKNELIETNKYNNVLVFPVNCGGVTKDLKYLCNTETKTCDIDASGSMSLEECTSSCKIGDKSLPDLVIASFTPDKIKINETLPLVITEKNDGNSKAERHGYNFTVAFGGDSKTQPGVFNELAAKATQEAKGNWTCTVAGVYAITIDLDPENNIKESNEANNKKIFTIECSDENGNVPKDEAKEKEEEKTGNGGTELPDLVITLDPTKMDNGKNNIKVNIKNDSQQNITKSFYFLIELLDGEGKVAKSYDPVEIKGMAAGKNAGGELFTGGVTCDPNTPFKIRVTIDSTKVIAEKLENNNYAESTCGTVKSSSGNNGGGNEERVKDAPPCASGPATLEIKSLASQTPTDLANDRVISYKIANNNSTRAEGVKVNVYNGSKLVKSQNISSITGCSSYNAATYESSLVYTCEGSEQTVNFVVTYDGTKSVSKSVEVKCEGKTNANQTLYCEIDKAVNSTGEVRITTGENIKYTVKISGNTTVQLDPSKVTWYGTDSYSGLVAYKKFNGFANGRYSVTGVSAKYWYVDEKNQPQSYNIGCQNLTVIIGNNTTTPGKVPNLSTDTQCVTNLDLKSNPYSVCFTNYISDVNSLCTLTYSWESLNNSLYVLTNPTSSSKTTCISPKLSSWKEGVSEAVKSTAKCTYNGEEYSQTVTCKINAYTGGSGSTTTTTTTTTTKASGEGGYNPTPTDPIKSGDLAATCSCTSSGCNVNITGSSSDYNAYTCTWTINGSVKSYVSTCKGINASNISSGGVKVVEDSTEKSVSATCTMK